MSSSFYLEIWMRKVIILLITIFFISCISTKKENVGIFFEEPENYNFLVTIYNKTIWDISILSENKERMILSGKNETVSLPIQNNELSIPYEIKCYVRITDDVVKTIKLTNRIIKKGDNNVFINEDFFENNENYFIIYNNSDSFIKVIRPNSNTIRSGLGSNAERNSSNLKYELQKGESNVYISDNFPCSVLNEKGTLFPILQKSNNGFVSYFTFDGIKLTITDSRPLHRIGESQWNIPINKSTGKMPLVTLNNEIHLFVPSEKMLTRHVYDSSGNVKDKIQCGSSFNIECTFSADDGFLVAGYEKDNRGNKPVARILNNNGTTRSVLEESFDYPTASFFTAAQKKDDNLWLLAGEAEKSGTFGNLAYARLVRDNGRELKSEKELGGGDFSNNKARGSKIESAVYNSLRNCWIVSGECNNLNTDEFIGSFIAEIDDNGIILKFDNSFNNILFKKITTDNKETCYIAGEEHIGNETYAVLYKYDLNSSQKKKISTQASSHSYYHDALIDINSNQIVLAGVIQAKNETGQGGIPFIEAIDLDKGTLLWREMYHDFSSQNVSLVTAIAHAPEYGYALSLSSLDLKGNYGKPYMIARVNSQGKLLKE